jgi:hypothetical protein
MLILSKKFKLITEEICTTLFIIIKRIASGKRVKIQEEVRWD